MSSQSSTPECPLAGRGARLRPVVARWLSGLAFSVGPVVVALMITGAILLLMGVNPLTYYGYVVHRGLLTPSGIQATLTRMGPLLLIAASLIVAFRAGIWNLGGDGQFLLGAVLAAACAPWLINWLPVWLTLLVCMTIGMLIGAIWALLPAVLKARHQINEIITTMMMSLLGLSLANMLVKLVFLDPTTTVPQTRTLDIASRLPTLAGSHISSGLLIGVAVIVAVHLVMTRTAFGLQLRVVGASPRAAVHAGLPMTRLTLAVFAISAALAGLAGAVEVLGIQGNVRADWNPAYSLAVVPLVFLARFNGYATLLFVFAFSILSIGGESAARMLRVPNFFTLVTVAVLLMVLALFELIERRRRAAKRN